QLGEAFNVPELNRPERRRPQVTPQVLLDLSLGDSQSESADRGWGGPNWPGALQGPHRRVVDACEGNAGFPLAFAYTFLVPNKSTTAVVLRHGAFRSHSATRCGKNTKSARR